MKIDKEISKDIKNSPIWKDCLHSTDNGITDKDYCYSIAFDGLVPVQVKNISKKK